MNALVLALAIVAAILAGIVEKGRLQADVEGRLASLTALDSARAELLAVVTHELRTPLSVVRVYAFPRRKLDIIIENNPRLAILLCRQITAQ